jgi:hypothetical protein
VSLGDSRRAISEANIPTIGIIENMSHFLVIRTTGRHLRTR